MATYRKPLLDKHGNHIIPVMDKEICYLDDPSGLEPVEEQPWIEPEMLTSDTIKLFAYLPGQTIRISTCSLAGVISATNGKQKWFLPLNKSLDLVTSATVSLANSPNSFYFRCVRTESSNMSGRQQTGAASGVALTGNGIWFETGLTDSSGNVHQYDLCVGTFGEITIVFS